MYGAGVHRNSPRLVLNLAVNLLIKTIFKNAFKNCRLKKKKKDMLRKILSCSFLVYYKTHCKNVSKEASEIFKISMRRSCLNWINVVNREMLYKNYNS